jgi:YfiR/HmsC-like
MALLTRPPWRGPVPWLALLSALASLAAVCHAGDDQGQLEYEVKTAFLYNFAKFVQWPADAVSGGAPIRLCILGQDPFGSLLESGLRGKTLGEKPIEIGRLSDARQVTGCQVLFISASERSQAAAILEVLSARPILTVSEIPGFAADGGMVNFYIEDRRIRFEINPKSAARCGLRISSQLLKLSRIVDTKPAGGAR